MNAIKCLLHQPVLLAEAMQALALREDGCYVDATFGGGGHSSAILENLGPCGRLIAMDRDPAAIQAGSAVQDSRFSLVHARFSNLALELANKRCEYADGILFDLGVSSLQLDEPGRGMGFRFNAPLDMRMDTTQLETAADWIAHASTRELEEVIRNYGEERFAHKIATTIVAARDRQSISSTWELASLVASVVVAGKKNKHPATRTFQAIRIHINRELEELSNALPQAVAKLRPCGKLVVISFHSLEDRIVKRFMRDSAMPDKMPKRLPVKAAQLAKPLMRLVGKAHRPGSVEIASNPRARSAIMRVAEKC